MFDANLFRLKNYFLKYKINKIFFSSFYDFRGRKYYDSIVGPTYSSICRYIFYYGKYEEYKKENCGLTSKIISNFYFFIEKLKNMLEIKNNELNEAIF